MELALGLESFQLQKQTSTKVISKAWQQSRNFFTLTNLNSFLLQISSNLERYSYFRVIYFSTDVRLTAKIIIQTQKYVLTFPDLSSVLLVSLAFWKRISCAIQADPGEGESGWMYTLVDGWGWGSAGPIPDHVPALNLYRFPSDSLVSRIKK